MIEETQLPERYRDVIDEQVSVYDQGRSIQVRNKIPDTTQIPIENRKHWLRIPEVICVFVDMRGSTRLSAETYDESTAGAYQLFSGTAVRLFSEFEAPYIDVRGDGVFALFDQNQPFRALAAAVTFKTFAAKVFTPKIRDTTGVDVGAHLGIAQRTVLVRKLGFKRYRGRSDRQNEVWAGKPVNMAAKLSGSADVGEMLVSENYYEEIDHSLARMSCGCKDGEYTGEKKHLWEEVDLSDDDRFDFDTAYLLESRWCENHGEEYCEEMLNLDDE